jgi:DNA-binding NarL/FixJ family response regulator
VRIVIAEDAVLLREGLARVLTDVGSEVVAAVGDPAALLAAVAEHEPDLAIVDIRMPPTFTDEGARAAAALRASHPDVGILVLSQQVEPSIAQALRDTRAFGYLLKDRVLDVESFMASARHVARGGSVLDPAVVAVLVDRRDARAALSVLTAREREILGLMAEGLSNAGIAQRLWLAERTVETHVSSILAKLDLPSTPQDHRRVAAVVAYLRAISP